MTVEDIILDRDRRGISKLRPHLPADFCGQAAQLILDNPGTAIIITGFYILDAGVVETDGPPGAVSIGNALDKLGYDVVYVTDRHAAQIMDGTKGAGSRLVEFPITDDETSKAFAKDLLERLNPSVVIAIERCGFTDEKMYLNMRGRDITPYNARIDYLVTDHPNTVGIGDGGNEIGMGNLAKEVTTVDSLVKDPCVTGVSKLILASVSNWGGYGLVASISKLSGKSLMPTVEEDMALIRQTVDLGAVDGMSNKQEYKVDGFTLEENAETITQLRELLAREGIS
ncbi:MAG: DUF4392 domain-containing protein [Chloroflexi bacterium]|nr:DUF4392 domain-containing protein [Chloroflexota bacterium]MCI0841271.1 DUF4392 domain-containing protein [Chloroflexota bacterium]MCI0887465.1 DUF4392 domain-containing protein [Chloroflexota bacterium]